MTLMLDIPAQTHKEYDSTEGRNVDRLPKIFQRDGREPMFMADILQQRSDVRKYDLSKPAFNEVREAWWGNWFYNGDLWLRDSATKSGKIVCYGADALELLKQISPQDQLVDNAKVLPNGFFERAEGLGLTAKDIERLHGKGYTPREAKKSREWRYLAGTQERLDQYVDDVVKETGRTNDLMNLYFGGVSTVPTGRLWCVYSRYGGSSADCDYDLYSNSGRLVGVAPEAHVAREKK
ncbi:MAG: hypothetical protein V2A62_00105 [Candidatus Woesearchaeota archaeon]